MKERLMVNSDVNGVNVGTFLKRILDESHEPMAITTIGGVVLLTNENFCAFRSSEPQFNTESLLTRSLIGSDQSKFTIPFNGAHGNYSLEMCRIHFGEGDEAGFLLNCRKDQTIVEYQDHKPDIRVNLSALRNLYKSFMDTAFEGIVRTELDGKIVFVNRAFLKMLGIESYSKAKNQFIQGFFKERNDFVTAQERLKQRDPLTDVVIAFRRRDGGELSARVNANSHLDSAGNVVFDWTLLDITKQVESESALKTKNDQLEKVNHQMEKFLYSASHDLRSPITSVLGLINLMRMDNEDQAMRDYISKMEISVLRLDKIIKDIMSFSRASYQRITSERIDFNFLAWKAINQSRKDASSRKISVDVKLEGSFPFFGDSDRIEIILDNIISNAFQFYDSSKSRPLLVIDIKIDRTKASLEFIDNGVGIGSMHLENIFNMFYKASHLSKGAGLGLFIVKETLQDIKGSIQVESEVGFGTVFRLEIPNDHKGKLISRKMLLQNHV